MNWIENLLILVGISLDIFAGMECQGSLVAKIDKKHLTLVCGLIAIWQLAALYIGNVLAGLLYINDLARNERFIGTVIAAVIFFCLGVRLIVKAIKNERVNEHREENLGFKRFWRMAAVTSIYTPYRNCIWFSGNKSDGDFDHDRLPDHCSCHYGYLYRISFRV